METAVLNQVFLLLVIYQVKHFVADYVLQHTYMLRKVRPGWDFVAPLALHCSVHATFTLIICLIFNPRVWWLAIFDFVVHFFMDRFRSGPRWLGRWDDINTPAFWWVLGADQMVHHLTHIFIIWVTITF